MGKLLRHFAFVSMIAALPVRVSAAPIGDAESSLAPGPWDVVQVAVDRRDQPHWLYVPNDPRLLGRELIIGPSKLALNDGSVLASSRDGRCGGPVWLS
jgi:hypothetical protein